MKLIFAAIALFFVILTGASAKECASKFEPEATTGLITRMTLYKFADHYELQFLTPSQLPLIDMIVEIDGVKQPLFLAGGLDDELFSVTDDESGIAVGETTLGALAVGAVLVVKGHGAEGKAEEAKFALKGFGAATKKMGKGCG